MAIQYSITINLPLDLPLLTLKGQLYDTAGATVGGVITTGFIELLSSGNYAWTGNIDRGFQGMIVFYTSTSTWQAQVAINPAELENPYLDLVDFGAVKGSSPTPNATVFASDTTSLDGTHDDQYNGLYLFFREGVNKGLGRRIDDYVAATKTFTMHVAFPTTPAGGDEFEILGRAE